MLVGNHSWDSNTAERDRRAGGGGPQSARQGCKLSPRSWPHAITAATRYPARPRLPYLQLLACAVLSHEGIVAAQHPLPPCGRGHYRPRLPAMVQPLLVVVRLHGCADTNGCCVQLGGGALAFPVACAASQAQPICSSNDGAQALMVLQNLFRRPSPSAFLSPTAPVRRHNTRAALLRTRSRLKAAEGTPRRQHLSLHLQMCPRSLLPTCTLWPQQAGVHRHPPSPWRHSTAA